VRYPSPDDPAEAPVWDNYIAGQAVQASLALIPPSALAYGVKVRGANVQLLFQLSALTDQDRADMNEIWDNMESLVGGGVKVGIEHEIRDERKVLPEDGIRWLFLARAAYDFDHG
jgi:hypothetical protein